VIVCCSQVFVFSKLHPILKNSCKLGAVNWVQLMSFPLIFMLLILLCLPNCKFLSKTNIRQYILLTLSHIESTTERRELSAETIISRLTGAFACRSIVISRERHASLGGLHYHIGVWNENASKNTVLSTLRELFPEFEGRQLNASFHKGWNSVCRYLLKEDTNPTVWGEEPLEAVKARAKASGGKRRGPDLVKLLRSKNSWEEVLTDDSLVKKCLSSYSSVRSTFEDLQSMKKKGPFLARLLVFLCTHGIEVYKDSDFKERYYVLWWLAFNLCRPRHLRQRQLLILGVPETKNTSFVQALSEFMDVYFVPRRRKDFTGGNRDYDLWVIDELSGYELDVSWKLFPRMIIWNGYPVSKQ
jgi:hypothetical protein